LDDRKIENGGHPIVRLRFKFTPWCLFYDNYVLLTLLPVERLVERMKFHNNLSFLSFWMGMFHALPSSLAYTLITFDVDGTLIQGSGQAAAESAHALAFSHAVGTVLGDGRPVASVATALPQHLYHGSTDGLILLRLAKATLGIDTNESFPKLPLLMDCMYDYIRNLEDDEIARYLSPLPGVLQNLRALKTMDDVVQCGLVTGNVEGIARRKMRAVGIWDTGALSSPCQSQKPWEGSEDIGFLGGFGSDFCSGDIENLDRNFLDRGEQIAIATQRCKNQLSSSVRLPSSSSSSSSFDHNNNDSKLRLL
jgi:hypothetical protein